MGLLALTVVCVTQGGQGMEGGGRRRTGYGEVEREAIVSAKAALLISINGRKVDEGH